MQIDSSAMPTCLRLRSAVECTATVLMPSVWHARSTRKAISPRFAMTTLSSMGSAASADHEHRLVVLDRLAVRDEDRAHGAGDVGFDLVEHLHRFDDAERLAGLDRLSHLDERGRVGIGGGVERADHRRLDDVAVRNDL